jgi:hypothetical protein
MTEIDLTGFKIREKGTGFLYIHSANLGFFSVNLCVAVIGGGKEAGGLFSFGLEDFGDEAGPAGLMGGAHSPSVIAVKIFVE